ncbi:MAG TPA: HemK/PrmC family methyltransferase [Candidatus Limnocylindrales bacterium]|nr:HemK/PrmC family methyltransferase [Candidatus Limnocylindrales bacterium]
MPDAPSTTFDIRSALKQGIARLRAARVPSHTLAAELLLMHALGRDRTWLYSHPESPVDASAAESYFALIARRAAGEPTQYLTGKQEFWGLEFEVTPAVLIPRPETEHVIEVALELLGPRGIKIDLRTGAPAPPLRIADVGTGSGCIAVALARELPHAEIFATDISEAALEVARRNAARHAVSDRIHFLLCDLLGPFLPSPLTPHPSPLGGRSLPVGRHGFSSDMNAAFLAGVSTPEATNSFSPLAPHPSPLDLIVSNPPYVSRDAAHTLPREVRDHEPHGALFGGPAGGEIYPRLISQAASLLAPGGILVLELGYDSGPRVRALLEQGPWSHLKITNDLAGIPRVISAIRS